MSTALSSLKDIPGVFGSFVFAPDGALAARDMPAVYPDELFSEISRRLQGINDALEPSLAGFYELLAKFEGHWLLTRRTDKGTLNVLADETVNFPALKMATNVAVKHLDKIASEAAAQAAAEQEQQAAATLPPPPPVETRRRVWRGHVMP